MNRVGHHQPGPSSEVFWLRSAPLEELERTFRSLLVARYGTWERAAGTAHSPEDWLRLLLQGVRAEAHSIQEALELAAFCVVEGNVAFSAEARRTLQGEHVARVLQRFLATLNEPALGTSETANAYLAELRTHFRDSEGLRGRDVMLPLRAALTGSLAGPCLGKVTSLLGARRCAERATAALATLSSGPAQPGSA